MTVQEAAPTPEAELPPGHPTVDLGGDGGAALVEPPPLTDHWVHDLDSVLVEIPLLNGASLPIRYYSLSYLLGVLIAMWLLQWMGNRRRIAIRGQQVSDLALMYCILGIILGGRLGWVLFYGLGKEHHEHWYWPIAIWDGGMASHGGIAGVAIALWIFSRVHKVSFVHLMDLAAVVAPVGLCLGRLANFINGELWGVASQPPESAPAWCVIFGRTDPAAGMMPRHPSQLYEALGEGLLLFVLLFVLHKRLLPKVGACSAVFCFGYSLARIVSERFRQEDKGLERDTQIFDLSRGEQLTFLLIAAGVFLAVGAMRGKFGPLKIPPLAKEQS